jgi:hypothetical protein
MYRPVGSTSTYSASAASSRSPNTSISDHPHTETNLQTHQQTGTGKKRKTRSQEKAGRSACYAQQAACLEGDDGASRAGHSVKGSENGAYEGRIRRGRLPSDVRFTRPATAMARQPVDGTLPRLHLILRRSVSSRRRVQNPSWRLPRCSARDKGRRRRRRRRPWKVGLDERFSCAEMPEDGGDEE